MAYATTGDLKHGNIPLPPYLNPQKAIDDASDEIDSKIGFVYVTPVTLANTPENRPARLLLKRINAHLATGRLLMEAAAAQENRELHAYAQRLVDESLTALDLIADREIVLDAPLIDADQDTRQATGPLQYNKDPFSQVDAFYDNIAFTPPVLPPVRYGGG